MPATCCRCHDWLHLSAYNACIRLPLLSNAGNWIYLSLLLNQAGCSLLHMGPEGVLRLHSSLGKYHFHGIQVPGVFALGSCCPFTIGSHGLCLKASR